MVYTLTQSTPTTYMFTNETTKQLVVLVTNDDVSFSIDRECIRKFLTIEDLVQGGCTDGEIPLPNVSSKHLIAILQYMITDMERDPIPDIDEEKVQVPDGESREWWVGKARRENMRKHATSIPREIWKTPIFLNRLVKSREIESLEKPGGPADYLNYQNFLFSWGKTMGETLENLSVDDARKALGLVPVNVRREKINEYEEVVKDEKGEPVMEDVVEWRDGPEDE